MERMDIAHVKQTKWQMRKEQLAMLRQNSQQLEELKTLKASLQSELVQKDYELDNLSKMHTTTDKAIIGHKWEALFNIDAILDGLIE